MNVRASLIRILTGCQILDTCKAMPSTLENVANSLYCAYGKAQQMNTRGSRCVQEQNLIRFAHNWNVGILEYWNNGLWEAGTVVCWQNTIDKEVNK